MDRSFFERDVADVARGLIGVTMLVDGCGGVIVETEAYDAADPASHSHAGRTPRNAAMFGPAGRAYVYRSYGVHDCLNVTCGAGAAVLIRAIEPTDGVAAMTVRRGDVPPRLLCAGPGRLCAALGVGRELDGARLDDAPFGWRPRTIAPDITAGPRIGLTRAVDTPWRFVMTGSRFLSRTPPRSRPPTAPL